MPLGIRDNFVYLCSCKDSIDYQKMLINHLLSHILTKSEDPVGSSDDLSEASPSAVKVEVQLRIDDDRESPTRCIKEHTARECKKRRIESDADSSASSEDLSRIRKPRTKRPDIANDFTFISDTRKYRCDYCSVECRTKTNIRRHLHEIHHSITDSTKKTIRNIAVPKPLTVLKCDDCPTMQFNSTISHNEHVLSHTNFAGIAGLTCSKCFKVCETSKKLYFHLMTHNEPNLQCDECGKRFNFKARLKRHILVHLKHKRGSEVDSEAKKTSSAAKRVMCEICSLMVLNPKRHNFIHHSKLKPFKCDEPGCNSSFKESRALNEHKNLHTGQKPYVCEFCSQAFAHSAMLRMHRQRHINPDKFKCSTCGERFVNGQSLRQHETRQHPKNEYLSDARPFACDFEGCTSTFNYEKLLKRHKKTVHFSESFHVFIEYC